MKNADKSLKYCRGIFKYELKNRFLCEVNINGEDIVCYVPSSCHLSHFLSLEGKEVLVVPTHALNARTKYSIFAVPYKKNYIILNTSMANRAVENSIKNRRFSYLGKRDLVIKEHVVDGYKSDLYIPSSKTIIEIKSVISLTQVANFPTVYSERTLLQLKKLQELLLKGYKVVLMIVSLNPYVKELQLNKNTSFYTELKKCVDCGLQIFAYNSRIREIGIVIDRQINIIEKY